MSIKHRWNDTERKARTLTGKSLTVPLCQPKIPLGLVWDRNRASAGYIKADLSKAMANMAQIIDGK